MLLLRKLLPLTLVLTAATVALVVLAAPTFGTPAARGPLTGTWSGTIAPSTGSRVPRRHIRITINASESGGSWQISSTCRGPLTLDSISNGYHHYRRRLARGATCAGGDVDCLKRAGAALYDSVTSHLGSAYDTSGTLRRVSV